MAETAVVVAERKVRILPKPTIAGVLVHVDFDSFSDDRIGIAANVAARFGATLIGVAGWVPGREKGAWFAAEVERADDRANRILIELDKLGERFRNLAREKVNTVEWRESFHFPREVIAAEARAADLVVIGSHPVVEDVYHAFDLGTVLLSTGRPVLVVPDGVTSNPGRRVLVAWKESREARHAVQSALPYLKMAEHIVLAEVAEDVLETGGARTSQRRCKVFAKARCCSERQGRAASAGIHFRSTEKCRQGRECGSDRSGRLRPHAIGRMGIRRRYAGPSI